MAENFEQNNVDDGAFAFFVSIVEVKALRKAKRMKKRFDEEGFVAECIKKWQVCENNISFWSSFFLMTKSPEDLWREDLDALIKMMVELEEAEKEAAKKVADVVVHASSNVNHFFYFVLIRRLY